MSSQFKLTKHGGLTRRVSFPNLPSWNELAEKISALYTISLDKVAVSYVDSDEDVVTLSTNEELQDFYQSRKPGQVIKFTVQDLSASRLEDKSLPETPHSTGNVRNTFGRETGLPFNIDSDWQQVHGIPLFAVPSDGPHAFVEVVPTDASSITSRHDNEDDSDTASEFLAPRLDKGKGRAVDPLSSTASLLGGRVASEHDLHVFGVPTDKDPFADVRSVASSVPTVSAPVESTPKAKTLEADTAPADPPLPTFDTPDPTLTQDIAALLSTLSSIVSSHPELSEGLRNIVRNAANGTYWHTHREALRTAAQNLSQAAGANVQAAEEEAGRRVAEALGNIFRAIAQVVGPSTPSEPEPIPIDQPHPNPFLTRQGWRPRGGPPHFGPFWHNRPPFPPPHGPLPPGPPFPPPHGPLPPGPPFPPPGRPMNDGWSSFWGGQSAPSIPQPPAPESKPKPTPQELRAQVEAAKLLYKAEKERYRQEREERRKEKERRLRLIAEAEMQQQPTSKIANAPPAQPAQIVSQARGPYPQLEMFSAPPRRHNTLPPGFGRPGHRAEASQSSNTNESPSARALARINKKLADMGFTERAHPELPSKIKAQLPENGNITKENEDDIVTNLLEELIVTSPKGPHASSSGLRDKNDIPGAWH